MPTAEGGIRDYGSDDEGKLKVYKHRLRRADEDFEDWSKQANEFWKRYRNAKDIKQFTPEGHRVVTSVGVGEVDAMFSSLTAVQVDIIVKNKGTGSRDQARIAEVGINEVLTEQKVDRKFERAVKDNLVAPGIGWLKVGYDYAEETVTRPTSDEQQAAEVDALFETWRQENELVVAAGKKPLDPPTPGEVARKVKTEETVTQVRRDRIVVDYVPWKDVRHDLSATAPEDIRWIAQYTRVPVDEVRTNPTYVDWMETHYGKRKAKKYLESLTADSTVRRGDKEENDPDDDRITIVEFVDLNTGTVCTFPRHADEFLLNETANPFAVHDDVEDRNPFVPLVLRPDGQGVRGISDMELMAVTLDELQSLRSDLDTYISRSIPKLVGPKGAMSENGKNALRSREWGAYVELEDGSQANEVMPLNPPPLPQEVFNVTEKLVQEIREATGSSELSRGLFPDKRTTATTSTQVVEAGNIRQSEKRNRLERFWVDIARRILFLMQVFYENERVSRVVDLENDVEWFWSARDIVEEAKLECMLSPKEVQTRQSRRDNAIAWVNLLAPLPFMDLNALVKWGMEEGGLDLETIRTFLKNPEEQQQDQMAALQQQSQEQAVANGEAPNPASVPGPASGEELAQAVNPGELPPEVAAALAVARQREVVPQ